MIVERLLEAGCRIRIGGIIECSSFAKIIGQRKNGVLRWVSFL